MGKKKKPTKIKVKVPKVHHDMMTECHPTLFTQIGDMEATQGWGEANWVELEIPVRSYSHGQSSLAPGSPYPVITDDDRSGKKFQLKPNHHARKASPGEYGRRRTKAVQDTFSMIMLSMLAYRRYGQNCYMVGPAMQEMLSEVSLDNIDIKDVILPYPTIYINLQDSPWKLWGDSYTGWHECAGMYVSYNSLFESRDCIVVVLWGKANEKSLAPDDDATFYYTINFRIGGDTDTAEYLEEEDAMRVGQDTTKNTIETRLKEIFAQNPIDDAEAERLGMNCEDVAGYLGNIVDINRFIINFLLYITATNAELTDVPDRYRHRRIELKKKLNKYKRRNNKEQVEKLQQKLDRTPKPKITYIGESVEKRCKDLPLRHKSNKKRKRIQGRRWRPAYWNWYWVGSKKDEDGNPRKGEKRVKKLVEAYEINKDMSLLFSKHIHKVREPRKKRKKA